MKPFIKIISAVSMLSLASVAVSDYGSWRYEAEGYFGDPAIGSPMFVTEDKPDCRKCTASLYISRDREYPLSSKVYITFGPEIEPIDDFLSAEITGGYTHGIVFSIDGGEGKLKVIKPVPPYGWEIMDDYFIVEALKNENTIEMMMLIKKKRLIFKDSSEVVSYKIHVDKGRKQIYEWVNSGY